MKRSLVIIITNILLTYCCYAKDDVQRISNLITPVSYFVNHIKQLQQIDNNLEKYKTTSVVGMSGIGKTQIVRTYAYENINKYEIIWFIDCSLDINQEFLKLAKILNKEKQAGITEKANIVQKEVLDYLQNKSNWLIVMDNLKVSENLKIKGMIDWEHNGNIIFASQDKHILPHIIELSNFNNDDCIKLAESILNEPSKKRVNFYQKTSRDIQYW